jgi:hypothetical protein
MEMQMKTTSSRARAQERLNRLPRFAQKLIANPAAARTFIDIAPLTRMLIANGVSPEPDLGVAEFDACIAKDALGVMPLSDEEFEHVLRLSTPPECRETAQ